MSESSKRERQNSTSDDSPAAKKPASSDAESEQQKNVQVPIHTSKRFVLEHIFENVSRLTANNLLSAEYEEHFGLNWRATLTRVGEQLGVYIEEESKRWNIQGDICIEVTGPDSRTVRRHSDNFVRGHFATCGWDFLDFGEISGWKDKLKVKIEFGISFMAKKWVENPSRFDSSKAEVSDCTLVVQDQKFYVSKYFLATHSPFFKALLLGLLKEPALSDVPLHEMDPYDMENFLRVLYGYGTLDELDIEGLLLISDQYDTPIIREKCEDFLVKESNKTLKTKFDLFVKYRCNMDKILKEIKTLKDYKVVIAGDIERFDHALSKKLLKKSAELLSKE